jgi:hypothetical protein
MLIDAFHRLSSAGFPITDYQYTGMGSIYFVDFILFHKLLGLQKLLSVEWDETIEKRVNFNKPFKEIRLEVGRPIGDVIPSLSPDEKHILWLDYDDLVKREHLADVVLAASSLSAGSILLITVDSEPPTGRRPAQWQRYFEKEAEEYLGKKRKTSDFSLSKLPELNAHILEQAINHGIIARPGVGFMPMFNFVYKDGHRMVTVGGMIVTPSEKRKARASSLIETSYYRANFSSPTFEIKVPRLTRKERLYLDMAMPCEEGYQPDEFEIPIEDIIAYREVYRFFPAYAELLL